MIDIDMPTTEFEPGQEITGVVRWDGLNVKDPLTVRLLWQTSGKGDRDYCVVNEIDVDIASASGEQTFSFKAPAHPHSFSGFLISLGWFIEVVGDQSQDTVTRNLVIAPKGREILLHKGSPT